MSAGDTEFMGGKVFEFADTLGRAVENFGYLFVAQSDEYKHTDTDVLLVQTLFLQFGGKGIKTLVYLRAEGLKISPCQFLPEIFSFLQMADILLQFKPTCLLKLRFLSM